MVEVVKRTPGLWRKLRVFLDLGPAYNYFLLNYETVSKALPLILLFFLPFISVIITLLLIDFLCPGETVGGDA